MKIYMTDVVGPAVKNRKVDIEEAADKLKMPNSSYTHKEELEQRMDFITLIARLTRT